MCYIIYYIIIFLIDSKIYSTSGTDGLNNVFVKKNIQFSPRHLSQKGLKESHHLNAVNKSCFFYFSVNGTITWLWWIPTAKCVFSLIVVFQIVWTGPEEGGNCVPCEALTQNYQEDFYHRFPSLSQEIWIISFLGYTVLQVRVVSLKSLA